MPELPEVENIRRNLEELILGKKLIRLETFTPEVLVNPEGLSPEGQNLVSLDRRGKYLLLNLTDTTLMAHLRMTGKLLYEPKDSDQAKDPEIAPYMRARVSFEDGDRLIFDDIRRFGRISLFPLGEAFRDRGFSKLGPDAISPEWTEEDFLTRLKRRPRSTIKQAILDQSLVAGIGNIYADESLFRAGIRPEAAVGTLSEDRLRKLRAAVIEVLRESIAAGGTSFRDYVNSFGKKGHFQQELQVYQREGEPCRKCQTPIEKCKVAGRGTRYCPHCQSF
ncbi:MAG: bifunctional DNA-formamidopyrimidine glycosylase/DNA-(apurinic or apyrimidinic site) lyase [Eubacteriales bacterium]|nr:bifunctional DNA-formamidopyrimidine glycosylase/DNA-(apurinic or apyrimidinic site) lyase [Eubacteriales bacterium]